MTERLIRDISDTARWVAVYRARESERSDAVFHDPYARRLAGDRGAEIAKATSFGDKNAWSFTARTALFDRFIAAEVRRGADLVVNLAAGLDARPYRMDLPPSLKWVEVDLPDILDYKASVLARDTPRCALERVPLDLANGALRKELFARLAQGVRRAVVVTEGLLIYLTPGEVGALARDLKEAAPFERWVVDVASPALLRVLQERMMKLVAEAGASYKFGPPEGPAFFSREGWEPIDVQSILKTAAALRRLPLLLRLFALLPESERSRRDRPWSAVCLLERRR